MRRATTLVASVLSAGLLAACGNGTPATSAAPSHSPTTTPSAASYRTDPSGHVACSTRPLPWHFAGTVRFDAALAGVSAQLHAVAVRRNYDQWLVTPELTLNDDGQQWHTVLKPAPQSFQRHYRPAEIDGPARVNGYLCLVKFAGSHVPPAVLTTYTGGAHCCTTVRIYDLETKQVGQLELGNMGGRIVVANGRPVIEARDDAFSYAFTDFADSGAPIRIYEPAGSDFRNVTRQFPALVRADARSQWTYAGERMSKLGFYAAWAADEELLGKDAYVWQTMRRLERAGKLNVPRDRREPGWPESNAYIKKLRRFLANHGY